MQKKSLLVALFCGALCLTGCIKNEESASVAQVRIAKAKELESIADLNKAKAAAEAVYAEAELTLAKAEAELKKANAALVNAEAETEKVRAELLKVQVDLAKVKVDEEKVKLQMMEADYEARLAALEVEKAAAEAAKQAWANVLKDLVAKAEINAVKNAQELLEAEEAIKNNILEQAGKDADSAVVYAQLYFKALNHVAVLQAEELAAKAAQALVNQGAIQVREVIYDEIDKNNDTIAMNKAAIAYLKQYQEMDPEEAEAALKEARADLNEAYNAYMAAQDAQDKASAKLAQENGKTSDFWENSNWSKVLTAVQNAGVSVVLNEKYPVEVGDVTVDVKAGGFNVNTEDGAEYKPLFSDEGTTSSFVRYPDIHVIADGRMRETDHVDITTTTIAPAALYYDNIQEAMDTVLAQQQRFADFGVAMVEWWSDFMIGWNEQTIADLQSKNELQAKYVAARKEAVEEAEEAYLAALKAHETYEANKQEAWQAFQEYMLLKTDVSRKYFVEQYMADTAYAAAHADSVEAALALAGAVAGIPALKEAVEDAFQAAAKAEGVLDSLLYRRDHATATEAYKKYAAFQKAAENWNPDFEAAVTAGATPKFSGYTKPASTANYGLDNCSYIDLDDPKQWFVVVDGEEIQAGNTQDTLYSAKYNLAIDAARLYEADIDSLRHNISKETYDGIKEDYETSKKVLDGTETIDGWVKKASAAETAYNTTKEQYNTEIGNKIAAAEEAWNPAVNIFDYVTFPTQAQPNHRKYEVRPGKYNPDGEWANGEAGTAQVALFEAVTAVWKAEKDAKVKNPGDKDEEDWTTGEAYYVAEAAARTAMGNLITASTALLAQFVDAEDIPEDLDELVEFIKENIGEYIDEEANKLYQAFLDIEDEADEDALENLWTLYFGFNPDGIDRWEEQPGFNVYADDPEEAEFGWLRSSYNVDYDATFINFWGQEMPIAMFFGAEYDFEEQAWAHPNSYKYQIEALTKANEEDIPQGIADAKTAAENYIKGVQDKIDAALAVVNTFKGYEASYNKWVEDRIAAEEAVNDAKKVTFDAQEDYKEARAEYNAVEAAANGGMWVYDPEGNFPAPEYKRARGGFAWITINDEIEALEEENEELEQENKNYRNMLTDGKTTLGVVNEILDQIIAELQEAIEIWTAIANKYKAIMNAYLGIVEDGETGPLDEEEEGEGEE